VAGTLNVNGGATLSSANVKGTLEVGDKAVMSSLNVKGSLETGGQATLASANVKGPLTIGGKVSVDTIETGAAVDVKGVLRATVLEATTPLKNRMYPPDPIVYQDIFEAVKRGVVAKLGTPAYNDTTYTNANPWFGRPIIKFGGNDEKDGNGVKLTIPEGYDTAWVRVLGDRWTVARANFLDGGREDLGLWTAGFRSANSYGPDGGLTDGNASTHQWLPIPAGRAGELALVPKPNTAGDFWISGVAFSANPWAHAVQSARGYSFKINGGDATVWDSVWNNDVIARINPYTNLELKVPVVPSGRDKLLYLIAGNDNRNLTMHTGITVNGMPIERFTATYDNPFARHWNSKPYNRYIAARIPADLIPGNTRYLSVRIDMRKQDTEILFREIGTHDLEVPWVRSPSAQQAVR
jgi:hypothetical protein